MSNNPFLTQSEKEKLSGRESELSSKIDILKTEFDNLKEEFRSLSNNLILRNKSDDITSIESRSKIINIEGKLTYFESEFKLIHEFFGRLDARLETKDTKLEAKLDNLAEFKTENKQDIAILTENIQHLRDDIEEMKESKKGQTVNIIAIAAIIGSIISSIIAGLLARVI